MPVPFLPASTSWTTKTTETMVTGQPLLEHTRRWTLPAGQERVWATLKATLHFGQFMVGYPFEKLIWASDSVAS